MGSQSLIRYVEPRHPCVRLMRLIRLNDGAHGTEKARAHILSSCRALAAIFASVPTKDGPITMQVTVAIAITFKRPWVRLSCLWVGFFGIVHRERRFGQQDRRQPLCGMAARELDTGPRGGRLRPATGCDRLVGLLWLDSASKTKVFQLRPPAFAASVDAALPVSSSHL